MRLIDADAIKEKLVGSRFKYIRSFLNKQPTIDAVPVPCKIGDVVYGIRDYKGVPNVQKGFVSEMFFTKDMKLMIVIKYVCRGYWLEKVFPTYEAAEAAIRKDGVCDG